MRQVFIVLLLIFAQGCVPVEEKKNTVDLSGLEFQAVSDCFGSVGDLIEKERLISIVNSWATENCLVPCGYKMCASIWESNANSVTVYVSPTFQNAIAPEGLVTIEQGTFIVLDGELWHGSCTPGCEQ